MEALLYQIPIKHLYLGPILDVLLLGGVITLSKVTHPK